MHTGDLAVLDSHGYCKIIGRLKDLIIRGGENISPREVEEAIHQHTAVMDVQVCICYITQNKHGIFPAASECHVMVIEANCQSIASCAIQACTYRSSVAFPCTNC